MRHFLFFLLTCIASVALQAETRTRFNADWRFILQDDSTFRAPEIPDGTWQRVDLPHDWSIAFTPNEQAPAGGEGGWYPTGTGWYRKSFVLKRVAAHTELYFEGVYERADIYVNGHKAGHHDYGYTSFAVDITPYLAQGRNVVAVRVDNSHQKNCRWYSGSGIYRHVWLEESNDIHFAPHQGAGIQVTTLGVADGQAQLRIKATMVNEKGGYREDLVFTVRVGDQSKNVNIKFLEQQPRMTPVAFLNIHQPRLWTPEKPEMYTAHLTLAQEDGTILDETNVSFGIRTIEYDAKQGFRLNGQPIVFNGACLHHDNGLLGAATFDAAEVRKVRLMKEAGFNLLRTSHNPPSPAFLAACDTLGMLVIDEAFDGWRTQKNPHDFHLFFDEQAEQEMQSMVRRDASHPSIIAWSIGNEVIERKDIRVVQTAKMLKRAANRIDSSRPVTEALCAWDADWEIYDPHAEVLDIAGYNYMLHKHKSDHERVPERVIWQTESYPADAFKNWQTVRDNQYVIGDIVWTGLDYLGESGIGGWRYASWPQGESWQRSQWPWHGAYCGDVDITGYRKPISYYRSLLWNGNVGMIDGKTSGLYMAVREPDGYVEPIRTTMWSTWPTWESWNWPGWEGKDIQVEVYSRQPRVRLTLNGTAVEEKACDESTAFMATFTLPYAAGTLVAEALDSRGEVVEKRTLHTAGAPAALRLTADRTQMCADGQDLVYVTVEVVDANGRVCPQAATPLTAQLTGPATLAAFGNADLRECDGVQDNIHPAWHGRAQLVVRAAHKSGKIRATVTATGLRSGNITLNSRTQ